MLSTGCLRAKMYHLRRVPFLLHLRVPRVRCRFLVPRDRLTSRQRPVRTRLRPSPRALPNEPCQRRVCHLWIKGSLSRCQPWDRSSCRCGNARCLSPEAPRLRVLDRFLRRSLNWNGEAPCLAVRVLCPLPAERLLRLEMDSHVLPHYPLMCSPLHHPKRQVRFLNPFLPRRFLQPLRVPQGLLTGRASRRASVLARSLS